MGLLYRPGYTLWMKRWPIPVLICLVVIFAALWAYKTYIGVSPPPAEAAFGGVSLTLDYATTPAAREKGLSGRASIPNRYGMLFVFPKDAYHGFWMKDMRIPLDIFWLDSNGHVVSFISDIATSTYQHVLYPVAPARYVLETAAGFARRHSIATGTPLLLKVFPSVSQ